MLVDAIGSFSVTAMMALIGWLLIALGIMVVTGLSIAGYALFCQHLQAGKLARLGTLDRPPAPPNPSA